MCEPENLTFRILSPTLVFEGLYLWQGRPCPTIDTNSHNLREIQTASAVLETLMKDTDDSFLCVLMISQRDIVVLGLPANSMCILTDTSILFMKVSSGKLLRNV